MIEATNNIDRLRQLLELMEIAREGSVEYRLQSGFVIADVDGSIMYIEASLAKTFGYVPEELTGQLLEVLMPEAYRPFHRAGIARFRQTGKSEVVGKNLSLSGLKKNGLILPILLNVSVKDLQSGETVIVGRIISVEDLQVDRSILLKVESGRHDSG